MKINWLLFGISLIFFTLSCGEDTIPDDDDEMMEDMCVGTSFTYSSDIKQIVDSNCAVSGCHDGGGSIPNFSNYAGISSRASLASTRVRNGSMPPPSSGRMLTEEEIMRIACWAATGAPE